MNVCVVGSSTLEKMEFNSKSLHRVNNKLDKMKKLGVLHIKTLEPPFSWMG